VFSFLFAAAGFHIIIDERSIPEIKYLKNIF
jgi:hypothetical protein